MSAIGHDSPWGNDSVMPTRFAPLLMLCCCLCGAFKLSASGKKVVVLGIDGMDPKLLQTFVDQGRMPNFKALMAEGDFRPLQTTMPPQSPVAWSTFMTGMDPGGHGIYDFIHVDFDTMLPYSSMAKADPGGRPIDLGSWSFPTSGGGVHMLRKGTTFWQMLGEHGLRSTIFRMPVNFPPVKAPGRALAGMGVPDIAGTLGTFSFYTERRRDWPPIVSGGEIYEVSVTSNRVTAQLNGPTNTFRRFPTKESLEKREKGRGDSLNYENPKMTQDFVVYLDTKAGAAKFVVGDQEFVLMEKEWSDWVHVEFEAIPHLIKVSSAARFYLKQISPKFELYVTPLQIDPEDPVMPISQPANWSKHLCSELGRFYTDGIPEDAPAFNDGVLTAREFWNQMMLAYDERSRALDYLLKHQDEDFLFVYFGTVDQGCHMLWHFMDREHPGYVQDDVLKDGIAKLYQMLDGRLGRVREAIGKDTTLIVMSDHGFAPFYWEVNLNTWLLETRIPDSERSLETGSAGRSVLERGLVAHQGLRGWLRRALHQSERPRERWAAVAARTGIRRSDGSTRKSLARNEGSTEWQVSRVSLSATSTRLSRAGERQGAGYVSLATVADTAAHRTVRWDCFRKPSFWTTRLRGAVTIASITERSREFWSATATSQAKRPRWPTSRFRCSTNMRIAPPKELIGKDVLEPKR